MCQKDLSSSRWKTASDGRLRPTEDCIRWKISSDGSCFSPKEDYGEKRRTNDCVLRRCETLCLAGKWLDLRWRCQNRCIADQTEKYPPDREDWKRKADQDQKPFSGYFKRDREHEGVSLDRNGIADICGLFHASASYGL